MTEKELIAKTDKAVLKESGMTEADLPVLRKTFQYAFLRLHFALAELGQQGKIAIQKLALGEK